MIIVSIMLFNYNSKCNNQTKHKAIVKQLQYKDFILHLY